ncbi:hypothetical protein C6P45_004450 [Maudiozyma exigua]|uniref:Uncharacterized protein n=1 Tax=Maudiozyma exigua TaxID=34358 RepID=A0A9P7BDR9_MAUEX|nr:hypothetical protein C6P45_004450 [Kazachstania exigua]
MTDRYISLVTNTYTQLPVSIPMQALIDRANQVGHYLSQDQNQYWEYKLFSPLRDQHLTHTQQTENDSTYPFKYMTWVRKQNIISSEQEETVNTVEQQQNNDDDTLIPLDLSQFDRSKYTTNNNGLSADDIRGAVGGSESIPGFSSSSNPNSNTQKDTDEKITHITETPIVETPVPTAENPAIVEASVPIIEDTPGAATPLSDTPITETHPTETPVIEAIETTATTATTAIETPASETPTQEPLPESQDIEMKD